MDQDSYADYISAYKNYIVDIARVMTRETGESVSDTSLIQAAENIVAFETKLAIGVVPDSERRNATEMYNPMTYTELKNKYPVSWGIILKFYGLRGIICFVLDCRSFGAITLGNFLRTLKSLWKIRKR